MWEYSESGKRDINISNNTIRKTCCGFFFVVYACSIINHNSNMHTTIITINISHTIIIAFYVRIPRLIGLTLSIQMTMIELK